MKNILSPILPFFAFFYATCSILAQTIGGVDDIDDQLVVPWNVETPKDYEATYHFGFSEDESTLVLIVTEGECFAQIRKGAFNADATAWIVSYEPLNHARIEGNRFYSDVFNGQFAIYQQGEQPIYGLKRLASASMHQDYELGTRSASAITFFPGKYPQASMQYLDEDKLRNRSLVELQLMRNEIFARYGYQFKPGGKMDRYFKTQEWYQGQHEDVRPFLTELEKRNIALIQTIEKEK